MISECRLDGRRGGSQNLAVTQVRECKSLKYTVRVGEEKRMGLAPIRCGMGDNEMALKFLA